MFGHSVACTGGSESNNKIRNLNTLINRITFPQPTKWLPTETHRATAVQRLLLARTLLTPDSRKSASNSVTPSSARAGSHPSTPGSGNRSLSGSSTSNSPTSADNGERSGYTTFESSQVIGKGFVRKRGPSAYEHIKYPFVICDMAHNGKGGYTFPWLGLHGNKNVKALPEECPNAKKIYFQLNFTHELIKEELQSQAFKNTINEVTSKIKDLKWRQKVYVAIAITDMAHPVAEDSSLGANVYVADTCMANLGKATSSTPAVTRSSFRSTSRRGLRRGKATSSAIASSAFSSTSADSIACPPASTYIPIYATATHKASKRDVQDRRPV
ncbi:hypothetical protein CLAFUW4_10695 [Fulvia fulva]|uniref:Uncharacterized protein n=1 Tax=Passalora fulva TaxID=5499 RepID=A0A9Q8LG30_PASFU|nr:uncharacterized protein CLAFUR5_05309 [Fulvia fulva]KAK4615877.1 hypothetical protein CLAFUR4_10700 [Fulvia fulva]KAK4617139.1 hypothetical protein CLAFUR0_10706 [Fulvia fulva]UJO16737.1 hypothetical protein CLAFUR5_05309 [Fulvia fulva]WPV19091.1 hypothetical protein CLAFUW4_10695 [Fulvia fulva]WPV34383.1 hypothetical protein CLAFUW7_10697 [Fulvia fulva]